MKSGNIAMDRLLLSAFVMLIPLVQPVGLQAQADFRGRLNLDYLSTRFLNRTDERFNQDLELSVMDDLFVKNRLTLSYFLERYTGTRQLDDIIRQRVRANIVGHHYTFVGEFIPRYRLNESSGLAERFATGRRFNLVVTPPKAPVTSATFDWNRRTGGSNDSRIDVVNFDRFVTVSQVYRILNYRAMFRERKTEDQITGITDRRSRDYNVGGGVVTSLSDVVSMSGDYDFLFTEDRGDPVFEGESVIHNVNSRISVTPVHSLQGFASFLGNYIHRENEIDQRSSLSEIIAGLRYTPLQFLRLSATRDYRIIEEGGEESISDFMRGEIVAQGRIRERMEGRASFTRTFVIEDQDGSFPSQGVLLSLLSHLYPGVSLNGDINISQSESPERTAQRYQIRRSMDVRAILTGKIMLDFNLRTLSFGREIPWLESDVLDYGIEVNYQPTSRMTTILSLTREIDRRIENRKDFLFNGTLNYVFRSGSSFSIIYNRRGATEELEEGESAEIVSFSGAEEGLFLQLSLRLKSNTHLQGSFDTRRVAGGERIKNFGANLAMWF